MALAMTAATTPMSAASSFIRGVVVQTAYTRAGYNFADLVAPSGIRQVPVFKTETAKTAGSKSQRNSYTLASASQSSTQHIPGVLLTANPSSVSNQSSALGQGSSSKVGPRNGSIDMSTAQISRRSPTIQAHLDRDRRRRLAAPFRGSSKCSYAVAVVEQYQWEEEFDGLYSNHEESYQFGGGGSGGGGSCSGAHQHLSGPESTFQAGEESYELGHPYQRTSGSLGSNPGGLGGGLAPYVPQSLYQDNSQWDDEDEEEEEEDDMNDPSTMVSSASTLLAAPPPGLAVALMSAAGTLLAALPRPGRGPYERAVFGCWALFWPPSPGLAGVGCWDSSGRPPRPGRGPYERAVLAAGTLLAALPRPGRGPYERAVSAAGTLLAAPPGLAVSAAGTLLAGPPGLAVALMSGLYDDQGREGQSVEGDPSGCDVGPERSGLSGMAGEMWEESGAEYGEGPQREKPSDEIPEFWVPESMGGEGPPGAKPNDPDAYHPALKGAENFNPEDEEAFYAGCWHKPEGWADGIPSKE
eukprot:gene8780-33647_t